MSFIADKQTLEDLQMLGKYDNASVFNIFNKVQTKGAEKLLDQMFQQPLTNAGEINTRSNAFRYFTEHPTELNLDLSLIAPFEAFLDEGGDLSMPVLAWTQLKRKVLHFAVKDELFDKDVEGLHATIAFLGQCQRLLGDLESVGMVLNTPWEAWYSCAKQLFADERLQGLLVQPASSLSWWQSAKWKYLILQSLQGNLRQLLLLTYELEVLITVGKVARDRNFDYAIALPAELNLMEAANVRHPGLDKAIGNKISFQGNSNVMFLTGANMAGKSTLMKSTGIMVYLAHMGFPVAANKLRFSVLDGMFSSVNVPDDLQKGYSHFYAEVLRVKQVAEAVASGKKLFIIFDELFKGTNVKDAYDATLAVTAAFAAFRACFYIISTHIIEVGSALQQQETTVQYKFMPTVMEGTVPRYTYQLQEGITGDRQGMIIIENEKILEML